MLLDTSAWVEYFKSSRQGEAVKKILESEPCYTCVITIAEIASWAFRENRGDKLADYIRYVKELSGMLGFGISMSRLAGKLTFERKKLNRRWGIMDSFVLATGEVYSLKILTTDHHFEDLQNVQML